MSNCLLENMTFSGSDEIEIWKHLKSYSYILLSCTLQFDKYICMISIAASDASINRSTSKVSDQ